MKKVWINLYRSFAIHDMRMPLGIESRAGNGDIKPESRIAVSGFQTRPHAYFVTVRSAANPSPPPILFLPFSLLAILNPIPCVLPLFSPDPRTIRCSANLSRGFTNNVASLHRRKPTRTIWVAKSTYRPVTTD